MGATKEQAEKTKRDLLDAALIVFCKKGFNTARLEDISNEAGVTRGAFYWHFKNKTEVFSELYKQIMNNFFKSMQEMADTSQSPLKNISNVLCNTLFKILDNEISKRTAKLFYAFENTTELSPIINQLKKEIEFPIHTFFIDLIDKGKATKEIRNDMESTQIFKASSAIFQGIVIQIFNDSVPVKKEDIRLIINIFIDGIKYQNIRNV
jgi:AcrR family transcriptional regulator